MPKKTLENLTESMYYVLMALMEGEKCGTEIADYAAARTDSAVTIGPATLYTILAKFQAEGYIRETAVEGRKRTYAITDAGLNAYQAELRRLWRCVMDGMMKEVPTGEPSEEFLSLIPLPGL